MIKNPSAIFTKILWVIFKKYIRLVQQLLLCEQEEIIGYVTFDFHFLSFWLSWIQYSYFRKMSVSLYIFLLIKLSNQWHKFLFIRFWCISPKSEVVMVCLLRFPLHPYRDIYNDSILNLIILNGVLLWL